MYRPREANISRDHVGDGVVLDQLDTHHRGDRLAGQVVVGRAEAAAHDHGVGVGQRAAQHRLDATQVVADLHLQQRVDAVGSEVLAEPRAVGVDDLPEQQLGADGDDVTAHLQSPSAVAPATCTGHR